VHLQFGVQRFGAPFWWARVGGPAKRPKARKRGAKCLVVRGVGLVPMCFGRTPAANPTASRRLVMVPTVGAGGSRVDGRL